MKKSQLENICRSLNIRKHSGKNKDELVSHILSSDNWKNREKKKSIEVKIVCETMNETRDDIWILGRELKETDDLSQFTKDELLSIYNASVKGTPMNPLSTVWKGEAKEKIVEQVLSIIKNGLKVISPEYPNKQTIPLISIGTLVKAHVEIQNKLEVDFKPTFRFKNYRGVVTNQDKFGNLHIKLYLRRKFPKESCLLIRVVDEQSSSTSSSYSKNKKTVVGKATAVVPLIEGVKFNRETLSSQNNPWELSAEILTATPIARPECWNFITKVENDPYDYTVKWDPVEE